MPTIEQYEIIQDRLQTAQSAAKTYQARYECALGDIADLKRQLGDTQGQLAMANSEINNLRIIAYK